MNRVRALVAGTRRKLIAGALLVALPALVFAQQRYRGYVQSGDLEDIANPTYDGRFTFFRVRFIPIEGERGWGRRANRWWDHDTPRAEIHFMKILMELTNIRPYMDGGAIYAFGDKESFKYPIAYVSEPGHWSMNEQELKGVRDYIAKGGFIIFDDFAGRDWLNLEERWREAFPNSQWVKLDTSHPIFDSFFRIESLDFSMPAGPLTGSPSEFYGAFEDNDPSKRLIAIANYNNDLGDYMEWSDEEAVPIALSNQAYRLMVNYVVYAMTH
jgi:hypothetical protein